MLERTLSSAFDGGCAWAEDLSVGAGLWGTGVLTTSEHFGGLLLLSGRTVGCCCDILMALDRGLCQDCGHVLLNQMVSGPQMIPDYRVDLMWWKHNV